MGRRFDTLQFPGGKTKAFTLSYDDGVIQDRRLAELFRKYGAKATFNLNSGLLGLDRRGGYPGKPDLDISTVAPEELSTVYAGHEIAGHGLYHCGLNTVGGPLGVYEIAEDKRRLEAYVGRPLRMFAYPFGVWGKDTIETLRLCGYQGARTIRSTGGFDIPADFLEWDPTCHHNDPKLMELAQSFVDNPFPFPQLFYVWGHGYEFDDCDNWERMEKLLSFLSEHREKIWFATNGEILEYVQAYRRLEYSVDGSAICNPSALDVCICPDMGRPALMLKAGTVTRVPEN